TRTGRRRRMRCWACRGPCRPRPARRKAASIFRKSWPAFPPRPRPPRPSGASPTAAATPRPPPRQRAWTPRPRRIWRMADPDAARVHAALDRLAGDQPVLGIALSGGGDSTALMHLAHGWGRARLLAATVDHGLRPGSADEARQAGLAAAALDIPHETLCWTRQGGGNLMAAARSARLRLLGDWARRHGLSAVLLGHTLDDQAETLLMRLGRGAGVDGLSAMAPARAALGVTWLRPLLEVGRAELRQWLAARDLRWSDDPSNDNADFQRVRLRQAISTLDLPMRQLAQSAANL